MERTTKHIYLTMCVLAVVVFASCDKIIDRSHPLCDYTVQLRYDYNQENTSTSNKIDYHIRSLEEYVFDDQGVLQMTNRVERGNGTWQSNLNLEPGRYAMITIGNLDTRSRIWDESTGEAPVIGQTDRRDLRMELDNAPVRSGETCGPSEPLYYGYRTFQIKPNSTSNIRVDMVHAHLSLKFRVTWKGGSVPAVKSNYYTILETIPSQYSLMPEYYYPKGSFQCAEYDPDVCDNYESSANFVLHHIPHTNYLNRHPLTYRYDTYINNDNELWGEFTTYRLKNETPVLLKIMRWDEATQTATNVLKYDIDLQKYLTNHLGINLDNSLKQAYELSIEIEDGIAIISTLNVADWDEGGAIAPW